MPIKLLLLTLIALPAVALAQTEYLVGIPGVSGSYTVPALINALYLVAISIAALLAVIKIVIAGAKYMLSDVVTSKQDALKDIRGALLGLLIVLAAFLILNTINEQLIQLDALETIQPIGSGGGGGSSGNNWGGTAGGTSGGSTGGSGGGAFNPNQTYSYVDPSPIPGDPTPISDGSTFKILSFSGSQTVIVKFDDNSLNAPDTGVATVGCAYIQPQPAGC